MYKKIINPKDELNYRLDGIDNKYLINEGSRAISLFAATKGVIIPAQITPQDICFYVLEGQIQISLDENKLFVLKAAELVLIPKASAFTITFPENAKAFAIRL